MSGESNLAHNGEPQWPVLGRQARRLAGWLWQPEAGLRESRRKESLQKMWSKKPSCSTGMLGRAKRQNTPLAAHQARRGKSPLSQNRGRATSHELFDAAIQDDSVVSPSPPLHRLTGRLGWRENAIRCRRWGWLSVTSIEHRASQPLTGQGALRRCRFWSLI